MVRYFLIILLLGLGPAALRGQTREETMNYIVDEFKSLENRTYTIREITFSPSADSFTFRRSRQGRKESGTTLKLAQVDIYCVTVHRANGIDHFNLVARSRGRDGVMLANGVKYQGAMPLIGTIENEKKVRSLEKAFARLTALVTGRKELFPVP